ncbi:hypothetical protein T484DRAFT_1803931 [Baffinella frigidus]|nr:hypothetical protein T484DRAFT_1803931 [Cryptophyta sp. CCMP2293]
MGEWWKQAQSVVSAAAQQTQSVANGAFEAGSKFFEAALGQKKKREPQEERAFEQPAKRPRFGTRDTTPVRHGTASTPAAGRARAPPATPWVFNNPPASAARHNGHMNPGGAQTSFSPSPYGGAPTPRAATFTEARRRVFMTPAANNRVPMARGTDWVNRKPPSSMMPGTLARTHRAPETPYGERIPVPPSYLKPEQLAAAKREQHGIHARSGLETLRIAVRAHPSRPLATLLAANSQGRAAASRGVAPVVGLIT